MQGRLALVLVGVGSACPATIRFHKGRPKAQCPQPIPSSCNCPTQAPPPHPPSTFPQPNPPSSHRWQQEQQTTPTRALNPTTRTIHRRKSNNTKTPRPPPPLRVRLHVPWTRTTATTSMRPSTRDCWAQAWARPWVPGEGILPCCMRSTLALGTGCLGPRSVVSTSCGGGKERKGGKWATAFPRHYNPHHRTHKNHSHLVRVGTRAGQGRHLQLGGRGGRGRGSDLVHHR